MKVVYLESTTHSTLVKILCENMHFQEPEAFVFNQNSYLIISSTVIVIDSDLFLQNRTEKIMKFLIPEPNTY